MKIYADHAATTQLDPAAFEAMKPFLFENYGNASQLYSFSRAPKKALKDARATIAESIGAEPEEIYFTSGGTESDNWAINGTTLYHSGSAIVTSEIEHHAVLNTCHALERLGHPVTYLAVDQKGIVQPELLREAFSNEPRLVSIMYSNNEIGTIEPIKEFADITHQHGAAFHTDAVQAVGHEPINVKTLDVDLLSASAHKFNGPKGIGFLYVKDGTDISPYMNGGAQEHGLRAGTENIASIVGMAEALRISCAAMAERNQHLQKMEKRLLELLRSFDIDFLRNGDTNHIAGNISLSFKNADGEAMLHRLDFMGISISTGSACNSTSTELSHVIRSIKVPDTYAFGTIRISLGYENTEDEVRDIAVAIKKVLQEQQ